ncbi:MAG TPA: DUF6531 domain-containing protein, partial [Thermomicrobiales bacterium]|nr:DUF6531 domain-containing protein [Thermomicrobiales bacterium]
MQVYSTGASSSADTEFKDARFLVKMYDLPTDGAGDPIQTGYYKVKGTNGARLYQIGDNLAKAQQTEPFRSAVGTGVDSATGNFTWQETDLTVEGGPLPLVFTRYYSAHSDRLGPFGYRWRTSYDIQLWIGAGSDPVAVLFGDGREEAFVLSGGAYVPSDSRVQSTLVFDSGSGTYEYTTLSGMAYRFLGSGQIYEVEDTMGNTIEFAYNGSDLLESVTTYGGRSIEMTYDGNGRLVQLDGPAGEVVTYTYSAFGDLITVATNDGQQTNYDYQRHKMDTVWIMDATTVDDPGGMRQVLFNTMDDYNRVVAQTDANDSDIAIRYQEDFAAVANIGVTFVQDRTASAVTAYSFDHNGRTTYVISPEEVVTQFVYDDAGNLTAWVDGNGGEYGFGYGSGGDPFALTSVTDPLNNVKNVTVNSKHLPTETTDGLGVITTYTYDAQARLTQKVVDAGVDPENLNLTTAYTYDPASGQMASIVVDPGGLALTQEWTYNSAGLMITRTIVDPSGPDLVWQYAYDASGHLLVEVDPSGLRKRYTYTGFGRIATTIVDPQKDPSGSAYPVDPGVVPLDLTSRYVFDFGGKLVATMDPACIANHVDLRECQSEW